MNATPASSAPSLDALRRERAELRDVMLVLDHALESSPEPDTTRWVELVGATLRLLRCDFGEHQTVAEGPDGLYQDVVNTAPRLSNAAQQLLAEHMLIMNAIDALASRIPRGACDVQCAAEIRRAGLNLLRWLERHRQRDADLLFEAYETDIGGET